MSTLTRLVEVAPRVVGVLAGVVTALLCLGLAWGIAGGDGPGSWVAALGMLVVVTPLAAVAMALANHAAVLLLLWPVRWLLRRDFGRRESVPA